LTLVFVGVVFHELIYASEHPFRYGPAKVIAWAAGAGASLSGAVLLQALTTKQRDQP
jgi:hypothetical protein